MSVRRSATAIRALGEFADFLRVQRLSVCAQVGGSMVPYQPAATQQTRYRSDNTGPHSNPFELNNLSPRRWKHRHEDGSIDRGSFAIDETNPQTARAAATTPAHFILLSRIIHH